MLPQIGLMPWNKTIQKPLSTEESLHPEQFSSQAMIPPLRQEQPEKVLTKQASDFGPDHQKQIKKKHRIAYYKMALYTHQKVFFQDFYKYHFKILMLPLNLQDMIVNIGQSLL